MNMNKSRFQFLILPFVLISFCAFSQTAVVTARPQRGDFTETVHWFGRVESSETVMVTAQKASRIESVDAEDGTQVEKGASLFTLNNPLVTARLATLPDDVNGAEDRKVLSEALHVRAPVAGAFIHRRVSAGQVIRPGDPLAEIIPMGQLHVVAALFPKSDAELAGCFVRIRSLDGKTIAGTVSRVLPERTAEGATVIWIERSDAEQPLHLGETVSGDVLGSQHTGALCIPLSALVRDDQEQAWVFVKKDGGYVRRQVSPGLVSSTLVEILSGISADDEVVVRGAYELFHAEFKNYNVAD